VADHCQPGTKRMRRARHAAILASPHAIAIATSRICTQPRITKNARRGRRLVMFDVRR
jgi:hypothetical protein